MRSYEHDVPETITNVLSTHDWRGRKKLIDRVFTADAEFWHLFHQCLDRHELFGVYQMWGKLLHSHVFQTTASNHDSVITLKASGLLCSHFPGFYNFWIGVKHQRVVPNPKGKLVMVDLEETIVSLAYHDPVGFDCPADVFYLCPVLCRPTISLHMLQNIWWTPFPYLFIRQHLDLHVVLGTKTLPNGELVFTWQEDHIFFVESMLTKNPILTLGLGPIFVQYVRPVAGRCISVCDIFASCSCHLHIMCRMDHVPHAHWCRSDAGATLQSVPAENALRPR